MNRSNLELGARHVENVPSSRSPVLGPASGLRGARVAALALPVLAVLLMLLSGLAAPGASSLSARAPVGAPGSASHPVAHSAPSVAAGPSSSIPAPVLAQLTSALSPSSQFPFAALANHQIRAIPESAMFSGSISPRAGFGAGTLAPSAVPAASGNANNYVEQYAESGNTVQIGASNQSLANIGYDFYPIYQFLASSGTNTSYETHGALGVSVSTNGGASWSTGYLGQAASWTSSTNKNYTDVLGSPVPNVGWNGGIDQYTQDPLYRWMNEIPPVIRGTPSGTLYALSTYQPYCFLYPNAPACNTLAGTTLWNADWGIALSSSSNSGSSWATPVPVFSSDPWKIVAGQACGTTAAGNYTDPYYGTVPNGMDMAVDASGNLYVAYSSWTSTPGSPPLTCINGVLYYNVTKIAFSISVTASTNGGASWGAPKTIALNSINLATQQLVYPYLDVHLAAGPASAPSVYVTYGDSFNYSSSTGSIPFGWSSTSNSGASWVKATDLSIATNPVHFSASGSNWFFNDSAPVLAIDNWSGSSYKGHMYLVWNDNRSSAGGYPSVAFSENTSSGWTNPVYLSANEPSSLVYYDPTISVAPNGGIWVGYYGANPANGNYRVYGAYSGDGGSTWSSQFVISTVAGTPGFRTTTVPIFGVVSITGTSAGAYATWEDCRSTTCASGENTTTYDALLAPAKITSNAAGVSATVTVGGAAATMALPATLGLVINSQVTVSVPTWSPTANGTYINEFSGYTGATTSSSNPASFTYTGGNLNAAYTLAKGAWIHGSITPPGLSGLVVTVQDIVNRESVTPSILSGPTNSSFNATVPGGDTFSVVATAPGFQKGYFNGSTTAFAVLLAPINLGRVSGTIAGRVSATTGPEGIDVATVLVNGTAIPKKDINQTTGLYSVSEPWGDYFVNISAPGYLGCNQSLWTVLAPAGTAQVSCPLEGAWLNGSVNTYPATVTITPQGGTSQTINLTVNTPTASWKDALPGGIYTLSAHASGYSSFTGTYTIQAGQSLNKAISLTNKGSIEGQIEPGTTKAGNTPVFFVNGETQTTTNGQFNTSDWPAANYNISAQLLGYKTAFKNVTVTPGNTTWWNVTLTILPPSQGPTYCQQNPNAANCTTSSPPATANNNLLVYVGIGVIVVLVVVAALVVLLRRGGRGGSGQTVMAPPNNDPSVYGSGTMPESTSMPQDGTYPPPPSA